MICLRPYQWDVIGRTRQRIAEGARRVIVQGATGSGKTTVAAEILRSAAEKGKRGLFLAHRRRLVDQASGRLRDFNVPHGIIMRGMPRTSAPFQVVSKDTLLSRGVRNEWIDLPPADVVIVDECRNAIATEYQELLKPYRNAVILGLDATPTRSDGRGLAPYFQAIECTVPISQLVREGFLVPVRCYGPEQGKEKGNALSGDPVTHWRRYAEGRPTILFAAKREQSRACVQAFLNAGVEAEHLDCYSTDEEREAAVERVMNGKTQVICNVGLFTEGVDIPELSCCILYRQAGSYTFYAQAVGRIMRPSPGKTDAVLIDHAGAVYQHGFPDEDVEWTLDTDESVDDRVKKDKEEGKRKEPVCCPRCGLFYSGAIVCPGCGFMILKPPAKKAKQQDCLLVEVQREQDAHQAREERRRYWQRILGQMAHMGRTLGAAAAAYKQKFGTFPDSSLPNVPGPGPDWKRKVADVFPQFVRRKAQ